MFLFAQNEVDVAFEVDIVGIFQELGYEMASTLSYTQGLELAIFAVVWTWAVINGKQSKRSKKTKEQKPDKKKKRTFEDIYFDAMQDHKNDWLRSQGYSLDDFKYSDVRNEYRRHIRDWERELERKNASEDFDALFRRDSVSDIFGNSDEMMDFEIRNYRDFRENGFKNFQDFGYKNI